MAKIFAEFVPFQYKFGNFNRADYNKAVEVYYAANRAKAKELAPNDAYAGEVIKFPVADGYAHYMVLQSTKGVSLIWLSTLGDGYRIEDFAERGLIRADVQRLVEREKAMTKLFVSRKSGG